MTEIKCDKPSSARLAPSAIVPSSCHVYNPRSCIGARASLSFRDPTSYKIHETRVTSLRITNGRFDNSLHYRSLPSTWKGTFRFHIENFHRRVTPLCNYREIRGVKGRRLDQNAWRHRKKTS